VALCVVESPAARVGATVGIGLSRALECRAGVRDGLSLGTLHRAGRRLVMKQPVDGLWSGGAAPGARRRVLDLQLEPRDLPRAWPAIGSAAAAEQSCTGRDDEEADIGRAPNGFTRKIRRVESGAYRMARVAHGGLLAAPKGCLAATPEEMARAPELFPAVDGQRFVPDNVFMIAD